MPPKMLNSMHDILNDDRMPIVGSILAANVAVFCALNLAYFSSSKLAKGVMSYLFIHDTSSGRALPLLLSYFAHMGPIHLGVNMFALWSFAHPLLHLFGTKEQFWAAYISAGTVSSLGAICLDQIRACVTQHKGPMMGMGASGALVGVILAFGLTNPEARMRLVFLPDFEFTSAELIPALVAFDLLGYVLGWRIFGHSAHLGGAAAGYYAAEMNGLDYIAKYQDFVLQNYRKLRE